MVTEMITVKLEGSFLKDVDTVVQKNGYQNRTEFIRNALREKLEEIKLKEAMIQIAYLKGASKKKTSDEKLHKIREQVFNEFDKRLK
ncbi:hypothetical protein GF343_01160 [Candidatus Woesearchaeota archaeon]|nr:hypothetical protein [Candidatus Woesearchaeota archaeon]